MSKVRTLTKDEIRKLQEGIYRVRVPLLERPRFNMRRHLYFEVSSSKEAEEKSFQEIGQKLKVLKYANTWEMAEKSRLEELINEGEI